MLKFFQNRMNKLTRYEVSLKEVLEPGSSDLKRVGIFLMMASTPASFPGGSSSIFEAFHKDPAAVSLSCLSAGIAGIN